MRRKVVITSDGSKTIYLEDWEEQYHSRHGALREAYHVFIEAGLYQCPTETLSLLEIGFGTGLNALISLKEGRDRGLRIHYTALEAYPVPKEEWCQLEYPANLHDPSLEEPFRTMHEAPWETEIVLSPDFILHKKRMDFQEVSDRQVYDLVYFDAFGARVQPELWTASLFTKMFRAMKPESILVTYAAKGSVRRAMLEVGFQVERLQGPPGKREMLRARKPG